MTLSEKFSVAAVSSVLTKFILAGMSLKVASYSLAVGPIDSMTVAAILTPILGAHHLGNFIAQKGSQSDDKT